MRAIEVWINGEKKCVVGNDGRVLSTIMDMTNAPSLSVSGVVRKEAERFHVNWLNEQLRVGDEIHIRLIETEDVDAPQTEKRSRTQTERDDEIKGRLIGARNRLPSELVGEDSAFQLFEQRLAKENWVAAMKVLGELGQRSSAPSSYWKELAWVAFLLRHDEGRAYKAKAVELEAGEKEQIS